MEKQWIYISTDALSIKKAPHWISIQNHPQQSLGLQNLMLTVEQGLNEVKKS